MTEGYVKGGSSLESALAWLLSSLDVALMVLDQNGRVVQVNQAYQSLFSPGAGKVENIPLEEAVVMQCAVLGCKPPRARLLDKKMAAPRVSRARGKNVTLVYRAVPIVSESSIDGFLVAINPEYIISPGPPAKDDADFKVVVDNIQRFFSRGERGILIYDRHLNFYCCNRALEKILRVRRRRLTGLNPEQIACLIYRDFDYSLEHKNLIRSGKAKFKHEGKVRLNDGTERHLRLDMFPIVSAREVPCGLVVVVSDVTRFKLEEERNLLLSKFTLVGEMAATLAHEVRNPMTSIRGVAQLLRESSDSGQRPLFDLMIGEIDRADSLLSNFLNLARTTMPNWQWVDLKEILEACLTLVGPDLTNNDIKVKIKIDEGCSLTGDPQQLRQALLNLLRNACEAMPDGGELAITAVCEESKVYLYLTDTGPGIAAAFKNRVLEPFFTTKSQGTGLGLSVSYKIIRDHGGEMRLGSAEGQGTTVTVIMPRGR